MYLVIKGHSFKYECEKLCREFFPDRDIRAVFEENGGDDSVVTEITDERISVSYLGLEKSEKRRAGMSENDLERVLAQLIFKVLGEKTGYYPKWGILTGIRPSKVMMNCENTLGREKARDYFKNELLVSEEKISLSSEVADRERKILSLSTPDSFSLYISIPFCPTRCSYCSFISHSVESVKKLIPEYIERLLDEIKITGEIASDSGLRLETVYFGGGTPTTLSGEQLKRISDGIYQSFDMDNIREYTVEAGRPDTLDGEKLASLKNCGVTRISINPQTFSDSVLEVIGRHHTGEMTENAFRLARQAGFDNINMDLIAGLPTDTVESFRNTLEKTLALSPENITVHTLSIKRSSHLGSEKTDYSDALTAEKMLSAAGERLRQSYAPYYMYRQSKTLGNLENVGWCKEGREGLYNIFMMEEAHTVLACGAGAVTKLKAPRGAEIERIFNFKYPFEYIGKYAELVERKKRIKEFYRTYK